MVIHPYKIFFRRLDENYLTYLGVDCRIILKCVLICGMREFTRLSQNKDVCPVLVSTGINLMKTEGLFCSKKDALTWSTGVCVYTYIYIYIYTYIHTYTWLCLAPWKGLRLHLFLAAAVNGHGIQLNASATLSPGKEPMYYLDFRLDGIQSSPASMEKNQRRSWAWNPYCLFVHPVY